MIKKPPSFPTLTADVNLKWTTFGLPVSLTREKISLDNIHPYPNLLTITLLCNDSYKNRPIYDLPRNWKRFWSVASRDSGYFAAIYGNETTKQIVLAHRGTDLTNIGAIGADFAIIFKKYSGQMNSAATCIEQLQKKMKELFPGWALIITGHSLGSYLADVTTFSGMYLTYDESQKAFCKLDGDVEESTEIFPYTVGIDGPGSLQMLWNMRDSMDVRYGKGTRMRVENLPADHYVAVPNAVNSLRHQVGGVYQIPMDSSSCKGIAIIGTVIKLIDNLTCKLPTHSLENFVSSLVAKADVLNGNAKVVDENANSLNDVEALTKEVCDWPTDPLELFKVNFCSKTDSRKPADTEGSYARNRFQVRSTILQEVELRFFPKPVQRFLHRIEIIKGYTKELNFLLENVPKEEKDLIVSKLRSIRVDQRKGLVISSEGGMDKLMLIPWLNALHNLHPKLIDEENFIFSLYAQLSTPQKLLQFKIDPLGLDIESISSHIPKLIRARDTSIAREEVVASLDLQNKRYLVLKTSQFMLLGKLFNIEKVKEKVDVVVFEADSGIFDLPDNLKIILIQHDEAATIVNCKVDNLTDKCKQRLLSSRIDFQGAESTLEYFVSEINDDILPFILQGRLQIPKWEELTPSKLYFERTLLNKGELLDKGKVRLRFHEERGFYDPGFHEFKIFTPIAFVQRPSTLLVLSDGPGAGKSTFLTKLCAELKEEDEYLWVIRVNLNDRTDVINKWAKDKIYFEESEPEQLLMELVSYDTSLTPLLRSAVKDRHSRVKITLLLDALDEVNPKNDQLVIDFVNRLKRLSKINKLVVTTRPHLEKKLDRHMTSECFSDKECFSFKEYFSDKKCSCDECYWHFSCRIITFSLCPFDETEQVEIITKIMRNCSNDTPVPNVRTLLKKLTIPATLLGTPMMLQLLAEEFKNVDENSVVNLSVHSIYKNYIQRKIQEYVLVKEGWAEGSKMADNNQKTYMSRNLEFYFYYAAKQILQIEDCELKSYGLKAPSTKEEENVLLSHGLISGSNFLFEHKTIAETIFSEWLMSKEWRQNPRLAKIFAKVLTSNQHENVRMFMDGEAGNLNCSISNEHKDFFENLAEELLQRARDQHFASFSDLLRLGQHVFDGLVKFCKESTLQKILRTQSGFTLLHDSETVNEYDEAMKMYEACGISPTFMPVLLKYTDENRRNILHSVNSKINPELQTKIYLLLEETYLDKQEIKKLIFAKNGFGHNALFSSTQLPIFQESFYKAFEWQMKYLTSNELIDVLQTTNNRNMSVWLTSPRVVHEFLATRQLFNILNDLENVFETEKQCVWLKMSGENLKYAYEKMFEPQYRGKLTEAFTSQVLKNKPHRISALSLVASRVHSHTSAVIELLELAIRSGVSPETLDNHEMWNCLKCTNGLDKLLLTCVKLGLRRGEQKLVKGVQLTYFDHPKRRRGVQTTNKKRIKLSKLEHRRSLSVKLSKLSHRRRFCRRCDEVGYIYRA